MILSNTDCESLSIPQSDITKFYHCAAVFHTINMETSFILIYKHHIIIQIVSFFYPISRMFSSFYICMESIWTYRYKSLKAAYGMLTLHIAMRLGAQWYLNSNLLFRTYGRRNALRALARFQIALWFILADVFRLGLHGG